MGKDALIEKHRYINVDHDRWWDGVYECFKDDMKEEGIDVDKMYFSGFWSQGDGACFEGRLADTKKYLDKHHADQFPMIRKLLDYGGEVYVKCDHTGRYYHEYCIDFSVDCDALTAVVPCPTDFHETIVEQWQEELEDELRDFETAITEQWRSHMRDLYDRLEEEYDYQTSDEAVWETLEANEMDEDEEDWDEAA